MNWKLGCQSCAKSKNIGAGFVLPCDSNECTYEPEPYQSTTVPYFSLNRVTTGCGNCGYLYDGMCTKVEKCYSNSYTNIGKQGGCYEGVTGKAAPVGDPIGIVNEKSDEKNGEEKSPYTSSLEEVDPEVATAVKAEEQRQRDNLELIASENIVSPAIMAAVGSCLTNKYAEGYPGKRYYGGCENVDTIEQLAIDRAKKLFGAEHANVQPHCGTTANLAVYAALCQPGDTILAMSLDAGGWR